MIDESNDKTNQPIPPGLSESGWIALGTFQVTLGLVCTPSEESLAHHEKCSKVQEK